MESVEPLSPGWINQDIFAWTPTYFSATSLSELDARRPYDILEHAETLITPVGLQRADCLVNLHRAVSRRIQTIEQAHHLKELFEDQPRIGQLERLEAVGLARPLLMHKLRVLRNSIEHPKDDQDPPGEDRCHELADAVWYFLRATDAAARLCPNGVKFDDRISEARDGIGGSLTFDELSKEAETIRVIGVIRSSYISDLERPNCFRVEVKRIGPTNMNRSLATFQLSRELDSDPFVHVVALLKLDKRMKVRLVKASLAGLTS